jgi:hypothetical protein
MPTLQVQHSAPTATTRDFGVNLLGWSAYDRTTTPRFAPGELAISTYGQVWRYGKATAAIAVTPPALPTDDLRMMSSVLPTPAACGFTFVETAPNVADITAGGGFKSHAPFAIGEWGWIEKDGAGIA